MKDDFPSSEAYARAAHRLGCENAAIRAVAAVEAGPYGAFLDTGEPVILFERHIFHRLTDGKFDGSTLNGRPLSSKSPGNYGRSGYYQHKRLQAAVELDHDAALKSCSWGLFQIMGMNHATAGHPVLQDFINAMYRDVDAHLEAFSCFIEYDPRLVVALRDHAWDTFARGYNGPNHWKSKYAQRMDKAYARATVQRNLKTFGQEEPA